MNKKRKNGETLALVFGCLLGGYLTALAFPPGTWMPWSIEITVGIFFAIAFAIELYEDWK